jgi:MFS family permease
MTFLKKYNIKSRNIPLMCVAEFLTGLMFFLPVLALYFEQSLFSVKNVAIIFSIEAISLAFFEIPTGALSDILGRKKLVIMNLAAIFLAVVFLFIGGSMIIFTCYAILSGLARALSSGNNQSMIYDTLRQENKEQYYKKVIGVYFASWPLGASIGSVVGGYLASITLRTSVFYTLIPMAAALFLAFFLQEPQYQKPEKKNLFGHIGNSIKIVLKNKQLLILIVGWLILMSIGESLHLLKPIFFEFKQLPITFFGYISMMIFGFSALGHYIGHDVSEKLGNKKTLILAAIFSPLLVLAAVFTQKYLAALIITAPSILFGIRNTVSDYLLNKEIPSSHRATINSINSFTSQIGIAILAPFMGYFADLYSINTAFMIGAMILLMVPVLFGFLKRD